METERSLTSRAAELFLVDPERPDEVRAGLLAFRELVCRTPFNPPMHEFTDAIGDIAEGRDGTSRQFDLQNVLKALKQLAGGMEANSNKNSCHNLARSLLVAANRTMLERIERRDRATSRDAQGWTPEDFYRLLRGTIVALNIDNGHDGGSNYAKGVYTPARLEEIAYGRLDPVLASCAIAPAEKRFIRQATLMTDPDLPGEILKYGAAMQEKRIVDLAARMGSAPLESAKYVDLQRTRGSIVSLSRDEILKRVGEAPPALRLDLRTLMSRVEKEPELVRETLLTRASDVAATYGLSAEACEEEIGKLHQESKAADTAAPDLIDADGHAMAERQLFNILCQAGARRGKDGAISASFLHPTADMLFGDVLRKIEAAARARLSPEKTAEIERALTAPAATGGPVRSRA